MQQELLVLYELETLFPPLSPEEYEGLKADIAQKGILSPVVIWNSTIIDGHHRVRAAKELDIEVPTVELEFDSIAEAQIWALQHQKNRRNLSAYLLGEITLRMKPVLEAHAKQRQSAAGGDRKTKEGKQRGSLPSTLTEAKQTREELAKIAGVSTGTLTKTEYIAEHADEETKEKLRRKEKGTSINSVYKDLKAQEALENQTDDIPVASPEEDEVSETVQAETTVKSENPYREEISKIVHKNVDKYHFDCVNLMHIPKYQTVQLRNCLFKLFTCEYRVNLVVELIEEMVTEDGKEVVSDLMKTLKKKFK